MGISGVVDRPQSEFSGAGVSAAACVSYPSRWPVRAQRTLRCLDGQRALLGSAVGCRWFGTVGNDDGDLSRDVAARFASFGWLRRTERARLDGHAVLVFVIFAFALHLIE